MISKILQINIISNLQDISISIFYVETNRSITSYETMTCTSGKVGDGIVKWKLAMYYYQPMNSRFDLILTKGN